MKYHPIQEQILSKFLHNTELRYSEIRLKDIENDLFNYHLQHLVRTGLLIKEDNVYSLSPEGLSEILMFDAKGNVYQGLRVSVLIYVIDKRSDPPLVLSQEHIRQPYMGDINAGIAGKVMPGELIETAAERKLKEETGLIGKPKHIGVIRKIRCNEDKSFIDDGLFHVCVCDEYEGELIEKNEFGINSFITFEKALEYEKNTQTPGKKSFEMLKDILDGKRDSFYIEEIIVHPFFKN